MDWVRTVQPHLYTKGAGVDRPTHSRQEGWETRRTYTKGNAATTSSWSSETKMNHKDNLMIALKGLSSFWNREYQHLELLLWVIHFQHEAHAYTGMRWNAKGAEATTLQIDQIYKRLQCSAAITLRFFAKKGTALQCEIDEIWHRLHQELVPCANQSWWCERRDWPTREKMNVVLRDHGTTNSNQTSDSKRSPKI